MLSALKFTSTEEIADLNSMHNIYDNFLIQKAYLIMKLDSMYLV